MVRRAAVGSIRPTRHRHCVSIDPFLAVAEDSPTRVGGQFHGGRVLQGRGRTPLLRSFNEIIDAVRVAALQFIDARGDTRKTGTNIWTGDGCQPT